MVGVYLLFLFSAAVSILLYGAQKSAVKIGFGLSAISCFYALCYFVANMGVTQGFALGGDFLYAPKFELTPLGNFFSFVVVFIGFASIFTYEANSSHDVIALFKFYLIKFIIWMR